MSNALSQVNIRILVVMLKQLKILVDSMVREKENAFVAERPELL